jgi:hypothetical protein
MHDSDKEEVHEGYVEIIDEYTEGYASIDVISEIKGEKCLFKHLSLSDVIERYEAEDGYVSKL